MINILSYVKTPLNGKMVKQWIQYHIENETEYSRIANNFSKRYFNLKDDSQYMIQYHPEGTGCGEYKIFPNLRKVGKSSRQVVAQS